MESVRFFDVVDWSRPWLAPLVPKAQSVVQAANWRDEVNAAATVAALHNHRGLPIRFVPQADLPPGMAYEAFISATGGVPTRDNLHDFLNALVWLTFPRVKARLNALQAAEISNAIGRGSARPFLSVRGRVRDAATIFDENAALLVARDRELIEALREHRWQEVFIDRREEFGRTWEVWLFGHALMEKLVDPYKAITAHAWPLVAGDDFFALTEANKREWLDEAVAGQLRDNLETSDFTPLPVLGVPGWWERQDDDFYRDKAVFRPKRKPGRLPPT